MSLNPFQRFPQHQLRQRFPIHQKSKVQTQFVFVFIIYSRTLHHCTVYMIIQDVVSSPAAIATSMQRATVTMVSTPTPDGAPAIHRVAWQTLQPIVMHTFVSQFYYLRRIHLPRHLMLVHVYVIQHLVSAIMFWSIYFLLLVQSSIFDRDWLA